MSLMVMGCVGVWGVGVEVGGNNEMGSLHFVH